MLTDSLMYETDGPYTRCRVTNSYGRARKAVLAHMYLLSLQFLRSFR
jgi:hypothetical protein